MIEDKYQLRSSITRGRRGTNQNIGVFLKFFNNFYNNLLMHNRPNFFQEMRDPYGFALMCEDYENKDLKYDVHATCHEVFDGKSIEDNCDLLTYQGAFTFFDILDMLYLGFIFDYKKAVNVYENQNNAFDVFNQIINGDGFIFNRARPDLKKSRNNIKHAFESRITLNDNLSIRLPHIWRLCDGMVAPFIVSKYNPDIRVAKAECHGFSDGIFVLCDNEIIDCLKIGDTWFTDLPLDQRLSFAYKCSDYKVARFGEAWSFRSALDVGRLLGADSKNGLLIRGVRENFFENRWFNWSESSLVFCKKRGDKLVSKTPGGAKPTFYTLDGSEGIVNPFEERVHERVFLDDWDIREFQKIMELE